MLERDNALPSAVPPTPERDVSEAEDAAREADKSVIGKAEKAALAAEASRGEDA